MRIMLYSTECRINGHTYRYISRKCCNEIHKTQNMKFPLKEICAHIAKKKFSPKTKISATSFKSITRKDVVVSIIKFWAKKLIFF